MRVMKWIVDRVHGDSEASESPFGYMPRYKDLNWSGLNFGLSDFRDITSIDRDAAIEEVKAQDELFEEFSNRLPVDMDLQKNALLKRLAAAPIRWVLPE